MKGRYESNGARLSYFESGTGLPVLFLHPTPIDHFYWLPLIERLGGLRAIAPDFRGHGASELGTHLPSGGFARVPEAPALTMAQLATDIVALLDQLSIADAVFVGCSIGGYVMLELWRTIPERMRGLAFICSKPQPDGEANLIKREETIAKARAGQREALFDGMALALIGATARARWPAIVPELRARMTLTEESIVAVQAGLAIRPTSLETVGTIRVPTLAIAGGEDSAVSPSEVEAFRAAPGGCQFQAFTDAGHFAAYEQPRKVSEYLAGWLGQLDSSAVKLTERGEGAAEMR
jgi:3-oxoadipate enol-lactonase